MKKILHLITGIERGGGAEMMLLKTLPYLKETENRVCVIKGVGDIGKELEKKGIKVYYLEAKSFFDFGVIKRYKNVIKEYKPDVQVNYLIHADIFGRIFAKKFGVKKLISYIRNKHIKPIFVFLDKMTLKKVDYLLTNSEAVLRFYRKNYNYPEFKSKCIPNGVDIESKLVNWNIEKHNNLKNSLNLDIDDFLIVNIASLHNQKDHSTLFKAVKNLKDKGVNDIKILLCGEGKEINYLMNLRKKLELENEIVFLGTRNDIEEILTVSDIFVLQSKYEGMSNALLEAMNSSKACIVSDIEENKELIEHDVNGLNFKLGELEDLAEKIIYLKDNKNKIDKFGYKAKKTIENNYNIKKIIKDLDYFLEKF